MSTQPATEKMSVNNDKTTKELNELHDKIKFLNTCLKQRFKNPGRRRASNLHEEFQALKRNIRRLVQQRDDLKANVQELELEVQQAKLEKQEVEMEKQELEKNNQDLRVKILYFEEALGKRGLTKLVFSDVEDSD